MDDVVFTVKVNGFQVFSSVGPMDYSQVIVGKGRPPSGCGIVGMVLPNHDFSLEVEGERKGSFALPRFSCPFSLPIANQITKIYPRVVGTGRSSGPDNKEKGQSD